MVCIALCNLHTVNKYCFSLKSFQVEVHTGRPKPSIRILTQRWSWRRSGEVRLLVIVFVASRLPSESVGVMVGSCWVEALVSLVGVVGDRVVTKLTDSTDSIRFIRITEHTEHGSWTCTVYSLENGIANLCKLRTLYHLQTVCHLSLSKSWIQLNGTFATPDVWSKNVDFSKRKMKLALNER